MGVGWSILRHCFYIYSDLQACDAEQVFEHFANSSASVNRFTRVSNQVNHDQSQAC